MNDWGQVDSDVAAAIEQISRETLAAYREAPGFVEEHANLERAAIEGGYGTRQLFELVQNGADEMLKEPGRIEVVLTEDALYCANQGRPLSTDGVRALLSSYRSPKRGVEIGRFGLGFKSVLGVSSSPMVFSRSGSVGFDPAASRERIEAVVGEVKRVPVLRIGRALDPREAHDADSTLADLMSWATTVVKLPRGLDAEGLLTGQIRGFPGEFLLFAPHVRELVLRDVENDRERSVRVEGDGEDLVLLEDGSRTYWKVFSTECHPSEVARRDGGAMADREVVPLIWAVPRARRGIGSFWAFFPTSEQTTLSGVINAPWKLNEDRTRLIDGPFNRELLEHLAALAWERAQELCDPSDPGVVLDLMVGRGRERRGEADGHLTDTVNEMAKTTPSIPDQNGELDFPYSIELSPMDVPREVLDLWAGQQTRPVGWAHPSVDSTERRATAQRYKGTASPASVRDWLQALLSPSDPVEGSRAAIRVGAALVTARPALADEVRQTSIILDTEGTLHTAGDPGIFLPATAPVDADTVLVDPELLDDDTRAALQTLGVREVDAFRVLRARLHGARVREWSDKEWALFWTLARDSQARDVVELLADSEIGPGDLKVRSRAGAWNPLRALLLPGEIVGADPSDAESTIDTNYHGNERPLLELLGAVRGPTETGGSFDEPFYQQYEQAAIASYLKKVAAQHGKPNTEYLRFRRRPLAGPITPLATLGPRSRLAYTEALLNVAGDLSPWTLGHTTQERWPDIPFRNPVAEAIRREGILRTSRGPRVFKDAVGPGLGQFNEVLPVAGCSGAAARGLGLPDEASSLTEGHWATLLESLKSAESDRVIGAGYALAASSGVEAPSLVRCRVGREYDERPADATVVTEDPELVRVLIETNTPYVAAPSPEDAVGLKDLWGLKDDRDTVGTEVTSEPTGEAVPLADRFPTLRPRLDPRHRNVRLQPARELKLERFTENGRVSSPRTVILDGETLRYDDQLDDDRLLGELSRALRLDLSPADIDAILRNIEQQQVRDLRSAIRKAPNDAARLLEAVGEDELVTRLPQTLIEAVETIEGSLDAEGIAELALTVHGPQVLKEYVEQLERRGLTPPTQWAGSRAAVAFAKALGFGPEYAGFESRRLERALEIEGPPKLGELHEYQEVVVEETRRLLRGEDGLRGLLSLPTGAGKTRVTIEALVQAIRERELASPVLWVAQTEELCEQAVQAWSEVWRGHGPQERLTLSRLWGSFEADEVEAGHQVVVATIQKLSSGVFEKNAYAWLSRAMCLVVDEAHQSVGPSYTDLLRWQGMGGNQDRVPVIGLTATPFRGVNEEETKILSRRYGGRRLDTPALGDEDPYTRLQDMGILAKVDQETLPGSEIELSEAELAELRRFRRMPDRPLKELARDAGRNRTLLESIAALDPSWPVLLFAVSVEHAQTMAALLSREGISAAAISGETNRQLRRHYIDRFRHGDLRVITNFNVLTAGFDAPLVRALYVTRPVYAPNTYQQMIGRGLRGPLNRGTDRCLLVNVSDNVAQFGEQLAFTHFDYLWERGTDTAPPVADAISG